MSPDYRWRKLVEPRLGHFAKLTLFTVLGDHCHTCPECIHTTYTRHRARQADGAK